MKSNVLNDQYYYDFERLKLNDIFVNINIIINFLPKTTVKCNVNH